MDIHLDASVRGVALRTVAHLLPPQDLVLWRVVPSPYTWTKGTSVIFVDKPIGVGFSCSESQETVVSRLLSQRLKSGKGFTTVV